MGDTPSDVPMLRAARISIYVGTTLPDGFTPTWHLPAASIDEIARIILKPGRLPQPRRENAAPQRLAGLESPASRFPQDPSN